MKDWLSVVIIAAAVVVLVVVQILTNADHRVNCQLTWRESLKNKHLKNEQACREEQSGISDQKSE